MTENLFYESQSLKIQIELVINYKIINYFSRFFLILLKIRTLRKICNYGL